MKNWTDFEELKQEWMHDPEFKQNFDHLAFEHKVALELIKARSQAGLTQSEVAQRMGTNQSVIARIESGKSLPSLKTLFKYAKATQCTLDVKFHP